MISGLSLCACMHAYVCMCVPWHGHFPTGLQPTSSFTYKMPREQIHSWRIHT